MKKKIDQFNYQSRLLTKISHDFSISVITYLFSHYLVYFFANNFFEKNLSKMIILALMQVIFLYLYGTYKIVIRYFDFQSTKKIILGSISGTISFVIIFYDYLNSNQLYYFVLAIQFFGMCFIVAFNRLLVSYLYNYNKKKKNTLIYGTGEEGRQLQAALKEHSNYKVVAFIDTDDRFIGRSIAGIPVYKIESIEKVINKFNIDTVILAFPNIDLKIRKNIINILKRCKTNVLNFSNILDSGSDHRYATSYIQELDIDDLLSRESSYCKDLKHTFIKGKKLLITGAGGSIGSELCIQLVKSEPNTIILLDHSEYALYTIHKSLSDMCLDFEVIPILGSITDEPLLNDIFSKYKPDFVYHAAAYKHVHLSDLNKLGVIQNNIFGTKLLVELSVKFHVKNFILISTDKAVRPTTIMGATKRIAEMIVQNYGNLDLPTSFGVVRFGNVLGSSGSVVPKFREQIRLGGPITITHKDINRYFMSIPEASQLVILASNMANNGEVFLLDMGEPVKIVDLAYNMIALSGLTVQNEENPDGDIGIVYKGLHKTEKINEELLIDGDKLGTCNNKIYKSIEKAIESHQLNEMLKKLELYSYDNFDGISEYILNIANK